jgi:hypothetical protein
MEKKLTRMTFKIINQQPTPQESRGFGSGRTMPTAWLGIGGFATKRRYVPWIAMVKSSM